MVLIPYINYHHLLNQKNFLLLWVYMSLSAIIFITTVTLRSAFKLLKLVQFLTIFCQKKKIQLRVQSIISSKKIQFHCKTIVKTHILL